MKQEEMKIWDCREQEFVKMPNDIYAFIEEIDSVCRKHGFSISHQDGQNGFEIADFDEYLMSWLGNASRVYNDED